MKSILIILVVIFIFAMSTVLFADGNSLSSSSSSVESVEIIKPSGGRVSWLHSENLIAYDAKGYDACFDVWVMNPDGSNSHRISGPESGLPQLNNGNPAWHPSGEFMVVQSQDPDLSGLPDNIYGRYLATPGIAMNNNLWILSADGTQSYQLTHVDDMNGTLHPHFSYDGTKLVWSETTGYVNTLMGDWAIKLADFSMNNGVPTLSNIQTVKPLNLKLYEMHGFSPDDSEIIYSAVDYGKYYYDFEIYKMNITTGQVIQLTSDDEWDEHAHYSPDGRYIIWPSSRYIKQIKGANLHETMQNPPKFDYWIMNTDGSNKRRLSWFNHHGSPDYIYIPKGVGLGDFDWLPDSKSIVAKMRNGNRGESTMIVEFDI